MRCSRATIAGFGLTVILAVGCGGIPTPSIPASIATEVTPSPAPSPVETASSEVLPDTLIGTWTQPGPMASTLVLEPCHVGERCGRFERTDDNEERCIHQLELRRLEAGTAIFRSADANSFGCAYSAWHESEVAVAPAPDDTVAVSLVSGLFPEVILRRAPAG